MAENFKNVGTVIGGDGDPANGDGLCTNLSLFPVNSVYVNNSTGKVFTRDAANGVAADWVSQSGGSSLLQTATVTLTDAQIKALPTTGVEVISALGVGKVALPIFGHIVLNIISPYVANSASSFQLMTGSPNPGEGIDVSLIMLAQNVLQSTGKGILSIGCPFSYTAVSIGGNIDGNTVSHNPGGDVYDGMTNQPVYIKDSAGQVSNYTGGNASNSMIVTVYYVVVDL